MEAEGRWKDRVWDREKRPIVKRVKFKDMMYLFLLLDLQQKEMQQEQDNIDLNFLNQMK